MVLLMREFPLLRCFGRAGTKVGTVVQNCRSGLHRSHRDLTTRTGGVESNEILSNRHFDSVIRDGLVCAKLFLPGKRTNPCLRA
jgi:hypothetical protein